MAGGSGHRMKSDQPKQYMDLAGKPIIIHTLERFLYFDPHIKIVLVLAEDHQKFWNKLPHSNVYKARITMAPGGKTRYESVKNGLKLIEDNLIVGIHDAVRPLVSQDTLKRCYDLAAEKGSCIPVTEVDETIRMVDPEGRSIHMNRSSLKRVQTPQVFKSELIRKAYQEPYQSKFTDDASVFESSYEQVFLVEGNRENIKITTAMDLQLAEILTRSVK